MKSSAILHEAQELPQSEWPPWLAGRATSPRLGSNHRDLRKRT